MIYTFGPTDMRCPSNTKLRLAPVFFSSVFRIRGSLSGTLDFTGCATSHFARRFLVCTPDHRPQRLQGSYCTNKPKTEKLDVTAAFVSGQRSCGGPRPQICNVHLTTRDLGMCAPTAARNHGRSGHWVSRAFSLFALHAFHPSFAYAVL